MNKISIINDLLTMATIAVENESLEAGYNVREISLNNEYPIAGKTAYAITKFSVVFTDGTRTKFMALSEEDALEMKRIIGKEYDVEI